MVNNTLALQNKESVDLQTLRDALPAKLKNSVSQEMLDRVIQSTEPELCNQLKENFIGYTSVLLDGKFKAEDYLYAIKYVTYKLLGYTNKDSYIKTFPDRYTKLKAQGLKDDQMLFESGQIFTINTEENTIITEDYIAGYNKNKLVNLILEQTLVPTWVLNQDIYQEAINTQARLMRTAKSERVQAMAADSILNHLSKPESVPTINIGVNNDQLTDLQNTLTQLAETQLKMIQNGKTAKEVIEAPIIEVEPGEA